MKRVLRPSSSLILSCVFLVSTSALAQKYKLVWSDEFDGRGLPDSTKWNYDIGDGCPLNCGWGNNELQYFTKEESNARLQSGYLVIEAHQEEVGGASYTSARLVTKGKADWQYGRIEVRARLPRGRGTWPAIWMLPETADRQAVWPDDGEIDIMEHVGYQMDIVHGTAHSRAYNDMLGTQRMGHIQLSAVDRRFHTFSIEWTPTKIEWFVDGKKYHKMVDDGTGNDGWPFNNNPFYIILSLAVGGNWAGSQGIDNSIWPQHMEVDYVRVYQRKPKRRDLEREELDDDGY